MTVDDAGSGWGARIRVRQTGDVGRYECFSLLICTTS